MYELKRSDRIKEEIKLGNEVLVVDLDAHQLALEYNKRRNSLMSVELMIRRAKEGAASETMLEEYGIAVISVLELVFGKENTEKIIKFYEGRYVEMATEVFPFIHGVVTPKMKASLEKQRKNAAKQKYTNRRRLG